MTDVVLCIPVYQLQSPPSPLLSTLTARPDQMCPAILLLLQVRHDTVHDMWLRCEEIYRFDIAIGGPSVGDDLDIGDALVQDGILIEDIVEQFLAVGVQYQHFPVAPCDLSDRVQQDCTHISLRR